MLAIAGGKVFTVTRGIIDGGTILVEGTKIAAVGHNIEVPSGAERIDATGKVLYPGLIDAHTHVGIIEEGIGFEGEDVNEDTDPVTPHLRAIDGINPEEMGMRDALRGGITTICTGPGSANVIGGQSVVVKTHGSIVDYMIFKEPAGIKAAFGENPKRVYAEKKKSPSTRMATAAILREALVQAQVYRQKLARGASDPDKAPDRSLKMEALLKLLDREIPLRAHAHRADDIMTAIRIAEEFGIDIVIEHATEAHKIAPELARRHIPAIVGPSLTSRSKYELRELTFATPGILHTAGVKIALMTDHPVIPIQYLPLCAAMAVREGLPEDEALRALTINPAEILGVSDRVGSIEEGKDADIVISSGHPFDWRSKVEMVLVGGDVAYRRA